MHETPSAVPLGVERIDQAFPIVHTQFPAVALEAWRRYAHGLITADEPARGVMTAQHGGYIRGLFCHWRDSSLLHGDLLVINHFAVMDLFDREGATRTLIAAMEAIADEHALPAIHTVLPDHRPTPLQGEFQAQGHHLTRVVMCKSMPR